MGENEYFLNLDIYFIYLSIQMLQIDTLFPFYRWGNCNKARKKAFIDMVFIQ